ncbi:MAG: 6,7-dimethyl-8-ribityllumazine synthase [Spirochaetia bacterium]|nr:6,7-dimethyl-8-ribityllumazine synthase [Spirochaetia bacterium]
MVFEGKGHSESLRFFIAVSRFNTHITGKLLDGAKAELERSGVPVSHIDSAFVPGAFELPIALETAAASGRYDGLIALGCVISGETAHFDVVAGEASRGISQIQIARQIPIGFGLLTVENEEQAVERSGGKWGNKGVEAAQATLEMIHLLRTLRKG